MDLSCGAALVHLFVHLGIICTVHLSTWAIAPWENSRIFCAFVDLSIWELEHLSICVNCAFALEHSEQTLMFGLATMGRALVLVLAKAQYPQHLETWTNKKIPNTAWAFWHLTLV